MSHKNTNILIAAAILLLIMLIGGSYWYFFMGSSGSTPATSTPADGFQPFGTTNGKGGASSSNTPVNPPASITPSADGALPVLRLLSSTPVGGYGASTTARTTLIRWADRGRGNIYQATYDTAAITTISNTVVPRIYDSSWNKNLTAFIGSLFQSNDSNWMAVYTKIVPQSNSAAAASSSDPASLAPFALQGKRLPSTVIAYAVSPKKDKLIMLTNENGSGIGYISNLDGTSVTKIFSTPLTQVNISWPTDSIIAITTKGTASYGGFLYFVNPKTGTWAKVLGPIVGLSASVSHDGKYVLWSGTSSAGGLNTNIYSAATKASTPAGMTTLADKCVWGNLYTTMVYCGVPSSLGSGTYPDDWYTGKISTTDKLWKVDASSGAVTLLSSLLEQSNHTIDAFNLGLDPTDSYLFFMNKIDLSLWSLDIAKSQQQ